MPDLNLSRRIREFFTIKGECFQAEAGGHFFGAITQSFFWPSIINSPSDPSAGGLLLAGQVLNSCV
ncbi:hypothetical protein D3C86_2231060 [compost metagenome]